MANPLFRQNQPKNNSNPLLSMLNQLKTIGPSQMVFNKMYQDNPKLADGRSFRDVCNQVRNMTPEQAFSQYGLDFNQYRNLKW